MRAGRKGAVWHESILQRLLS